MTDEDQQAGELVPGGPDGPEPPKKESKGAAAGEQVPRDYQSTEYVVLMRERGDRDNVWIEVTREPIRASSAKAAVAVATRVPDPADGDYKAIPSRSWRTFRVSESRPEPRRTVEEVDG